VNAAFQTALPEHFALAASPQLAENSRLGFAPVASTSHWGFSFSISSHTLGLSGSLYDGRIGSCSTGKERDAESGNDYFGARYYASSMGRFLSPDWSAKIAPVPYAKLDNPQSLNLYSYMLNNPLRGVDPDGHDGDICKQNGADCSGKITTTWDKQSQTTTATQGISETKTSDPDKNGQVTKTTTSTITTVVTDYQNNVVSTHQDQSVTTQTLDSKGNATSPEQTQTTHGSLSPENPTVKTLQGAAASWQNQTITHSILSLPLGLLPGASPVANWLDKIDKMVPSQFLYPHTGDSDLDDALRE
jgi:RHS repeat-associated protein